MKTNEYIIIHHSLVSRNKNSAQFKAIDNFHKRKGWGRCGYHYVIEPDGKVEIGREHNEVGAHCTQKWMNYRSIGICLSGNFDLEEPTKEQKESLLKLLNELQAKYGIDDSKVKLHRDFATYKTCPGSRIPNDIRGYLDLEDDCPKWAKKGREWVIRQGISNGSRPNELVTRAEIFTMLYNTFNKESEE